jgi:hypothetical protein
MTAFWPAAYTHPYESQQDIRAKIQRRLSAGDDCMIAEYKGEIVFMSWIGYQKTHSFYEYENKRGLMAHEAIIYNTFCAEEYRGKKLMGGVKVNIINMFKGESINKIISYVSFNNLAAIKVNIGLVGPPMQTLYWLEILGIRLLFLTKRRDMGS